MNERPRTIVWVGVLVFIAALAWPTVALLAQVVASGVAPRDGWAFPDRYLTLLGRSVWLAGLAALFGAVLSLPGAYLVGRRGSLTAQPWLIAAFAATLFCPPMVFVFGWLELPFIERGGALWCVTAWALWAWPIPSVLIGVAWASRGRAAFEAALLDGSRAKAFARGALPVLRSTVVIAYGILFVLFFNDYGVPHAMGLTVYATELLVSATESNQPIDTLWAALPGVGVSVVVLTVIGVFGTGAGLAEGRQRDFAGGRMVPAALILGVCWLLPLAILVATKGSWSKARFTAVAYGGDSLVTFLCALASGLLVVVMGLALKGRVRTLCLIWSLGLGFLPGALVGQALIAAYNRPAFGWLYDHWPIVVLGYAARFGWLGIMVVGDCSAGPFSRITRQAALDGAVGWRLWRHVQLPLRGPALICACVVVMALALAEVPTTTLLRVPDFRPIALVLIEKFHRFEDGILVSLSVTLVFAAFCASLTVGWALRPRSA